MVTGPSAFLSAIVLLFSVPLLVESTAVECSSDRICQDKIHPKSTCSLEHGLCINPYHQGGCLAQFESRAHVRACSSEDPPLAALLGYCQPPFSKDNDSAMPLDYPEVRIFALSWESALVVTWILQILLSEVLHIPVSVETGYKGLTKDFYQQFNNVSTKGTGDYNEAMENGFRMGNCNTISNNQNETDQYVPCAHFVPEIWDESLFFRQSRDAGPFDAPNMLGPLGQQGWHIPKFTAQRDPSLLSWVGLQGNRTKLADRFKRPTTWKHYCQEVSPTDCREPDSVALRPPNNPEEESSYFVEGFFTGYFRDTDKNNCKDNPTNCTGHFVDYPCGWHSHLEPLTYYHDIALESDGDEPYSNGYTYQEMTQIIQASNATKSDIILQWFSPDPTFSSFLGTDSELLPVIMPLPTKECIDNRVKAKDRCSPDPLVRRGKPEGACQQKGRPLQTLATANLKGLSEGSDIPSALHSPAYQVLSPFRLSTWQIGEIMQRVQQKEPEATRAVVCDWFVENLDQMMGFVPPTYPRVMQKPDRYDGLGLDPLSKTSLAFAILAVVAVVLTSLLLFSYRQRREIKLAQVDFLGLILLGLLLLSLGSLATALNPTDASCVASSFLVNIGYTLALAPLVVKLEAYNRILKASRQMNRISLERVILYKAVFLLTCITIVYMVIWGLIDSLQQDAEYILTDQIYSLTNSRLVTAIPYCGCHDRAWTYAGIAWQGLLLLWITLQVVQTRRIRAELNESRTLAMMIYSHFVFLALRLGCLVLSNSQESWTLRLMDLVHGFLMSLDIFFALGIYFVPKLFDSKSGSSTAGNVLGGQSSHLSILHSIDLNRSAAIRNTRVFGQATSSPDISVQDLRSSSQEDTAELTDVNA